MIRQTIKAFTLVELIVVVTVLAILSTIGFVSYTSYLTGVRDTNRVANAKALADGLEMYRTDYDLPMPENYVEIKEDGEVIAYQGDAGEKVIQTIEFSNGGKDPQTGEYMTYYLTRDKKHYQLMSFLEGNFEELSYNFIPEVSAEDYSELKPYVHGKKLGILTDENNTPIHRVSTIKTTGYIDIVTGTGVFISHFNEEGSLKGNIQELGVISELASNGGRPNNCLTWVLMNPELTGSEGTYTLTDVNKHSYDGYCNWSDEEPIPEDGGDGYELISTGAIQNGTFSGGTDILTETGSVDSNIIITVPEDELPEEIVDEDDDNEGHILEQEGDDSDYKVEIEDTDTDGDGKTEKEEFEEMDEGDVVKMCGWVKDLDKHGYIFNNIIEYIDGRKSYNGRLIKMFQKEKKGKKWEYHCVEHKLRGKPVDFLWRIGYRAEHQNKKFYMGGLEVKLYKKK